MVNAAMWHKHKENYLAALPNTTCVVSCLGDLNVVPLFIFAILNLISHNRVPPLNNSYIYTYGSTGFQETAFFGGSNIELGLHRPCLYFILNLDCSTFGVCLTVSGRLCCFPSADCWTCRNLHELVVLGAISSSDKWWTRAPIVEW